MAMIRVIAELPPAIRHTAINAEARCWLAEEEGWLRHAIAIISLPVWHYVTWPHAYARLPGYH